jgi:predicted MFS family arabinose efflux permease
VAVKEPPGGIRAAFWPAMREGLLFVRSKGLLLMLASAVGVWELCNQTAMVVQILFATRLLGLSARGVGLSYVALGIGTISASSIGYRLARRMGPGPTLIVGVAVSSGGWLLLALAPLNAIGICAYALMLFMFGVGAVFIFVNFLAMRQSVTPGHMLGRMTTTMRWLIMLPAGPGALIGGFLGQHFGLRAPLGCAGIAGLLLAATAWRLPLIRSIKTLPTLKAEAISPYASDEAAVG